MIIALTLLATAATTATTDRPRRAEEVRTGSRLRQSVDRATIKVSPRDMARVEWHLGNCIVRKQEAVARRVVAASNDVGIDHSLLKIASSCVPTALSIATCMDETKVSMVDVSVLRFDEPLLHGMLSGALYRQTFAAAPARNWSQVVALAVPYPTSARYETTRVAGAFGECVVRADIAAADQLVRAEPYSPADTAALAAVTPAISGCLNAGSKIAINRENLRRLVSGAMWRLANGADTPVAATGGVNPGA